MAWDPSAGLKLARSVAGAWLGPESLPYAGSAEGVAREAMWWGHG
jgi:hypothetical protein